MHDDGKLYGAVSAIEIVELSMYVGNMFIKDCGDEADIY